jgi:hypothetical protein
MATTFLGVLPTLAQPVRNALRLATRDFTRLPRVELRDVTWVPRGGQLDSVKVDSFVFDPRGRRALLVCRGRAFAPVEVPFRADCSRLARGRGIELTATSDPGIPGDRAPLALRGIEARLAPTRAAGHWRCEAKVEGLRIRERALAARPVADLRLRLEGELALERRPARVALSDSAVIRIGRIPLRLGFELAESGPFAGFRLRADRLTADLLRAELPPAVLGPLAGLALHGSFDYHLDCRVDFSHPEQATLEADVVPHGLWLDDAASNPSLGELREPFLARLHLPGRRVEERLVGAANPFFTPLPEIPPHLVYAVLANEDGGFFRHRGFSVDAMREALAANLRRGRFVRGAGTVSMQLVRNLYVGHERSLARKAQEVAMTWMLENLAGVPKERLLEIYLNVIEWAPGVHGAAEAARFYFDRDLRELSLDEALFLTVVVPSPRLWRYRFDRGSGELRPGTRQQMRFIARAMVKKGWLAPGDLPAAPESLRVELHGQARAILLPPAPPDSAAVGPL